MLARLFFRNLFLSRNIRKRTDFLTAGATQRSSFGAMLAFVARVIILVGMGFLILFPFFWMINVAVMTNDNITDPRVVIAPDPQNNFASLAGFWDSFKWSLAVTLISVSSTLLIVIPTAYAFSKINFAGKKFLWGVFLAVLALPEVALLSGQYKLVIELGIRNGPIVVIALFLPYVSSIVSIYMIRNAFDNVSNNLVESAMLDGAGRMKIFTQIMFPAVRGTVWVSVILGVIASWNSYTWPALLLTSDIRTLPIWLFSTGTPDNAESVGILWNVRMAASVLAIVPLLIFYLVFRRRILSSVASRSATKG